MEDAVERAARLMEEALLLLDRAGHAHSAALLDHSISLLPAIIGQVRERRAPWPLTDANLPDVPGSE